MIELVAPDHPALRQVAEPVKKITSAHRRTAAEMLMFLSDSETGVGLAANQIGITKRFFAIRVGQISTVLVNPELTEPSLEKWTEEEGCLSLPGVKVQVERPWSYRVKATFIDGGGLDERVEGWVARIIQHEADHLDGVLITDKVADGT